MHKRFYFSDMGRLYLSLAGAILGWSWGWVGIRAALHAYAPAQLALGRYTIASVVLLPFWAWHGASLPRLHHLPAIIIMGVTGFTIYNCCVNEGEQQITAGTAALLGAVLPILMALGARFLFQEKLTFLGWLGIGIAFAGVAITSLNGQEILSLSKGALLVLLAMLSATVYGLVMKKMLLYYSPLALTTWSIWIGALALIPFGGGLLQAWHQAPYEATFNMVLLGVFPGALCYLLYAVTTAKTEMAHVASWMFLMPLLSIILGWILLKELPSTMAFLGGGVTLVGAYLVNVKGKYPKKENL